jgi:hypothetical protein
VDTLPLFDAPEPDRPRAPRQRPQLAHHAPKWTKYRPKNPLPCDDCKLYLAQHNGRGPASRQARWRRKVGGTDRLLCGPHAQLMRDQDRLPRFKEGDL